MNGAGILILMDHAGSTLAELTAKIAQLEKENEELAERNNHLAQELAQVRQER